MKQILLRKTMLLRGLLGTAAAVLMIYYGSIIGLAAEGTVIAETAKVRADTSTSSEVVGSVSRGSKITIEEEVKDGSGTVWYKVSVGGNNYGYIRSDLVEKTSSGTSESVSNTSNSSKPAATTPTPIENQSATVSQESIKVRSGASTQHDAVTSLPQGTEVTLIGQASDGNGNTWYQITCNYNGRTVEGYVRSDLVTIGGGQASAGDGNAEGEPEEGSGEDITDGEGMPEGEGMEEPENTDDYEESNLPAGTDNNDYEIVYTQNDNGEYEYYLYNNIDGTRQKLADLLNVVDAANANSEKLQKQINTDKIIIIVLAVVIVVLVLIISFMFFKMRDLYYEDEEEDDEPEEPVVKKRKPEKKTEEPVRTARKTGSSPQRRSTEGEDDYPKRLKKAPEPELRAMERRTGERRTTEKPQPDKPVVKSTPKKPQNFIVDDEFEFEFLNMDDKDL